MLLDPRRDDGPPDARDYTFAALVTTDRILAERTDAATAAVRALVSAQRALQEDPRRATEVGQRRFPPFEASLISDVVRLDAPYYEAEISVDTIAILNRFARDIGRLDRTVPYEDVVATQMRPLWRRGAAPA